jgi:hypothetical protein
MNASASGTLPVMPFERLNPGASRCRRARTRGTSRRSAAPRRSAAASRRRAPDMPGMPMPNRRMLVAWTRSIWSLISHGRTTREQRLAEVVRTLALAGVPDQLVVRRSGSRGAVAAGFDVCSHRRGACRRVESSASRWSAASAPAPSPSRQPSPSRFHCCANGACPNVRSQQRRLQVLGPGEAAAARAGRVGSTPLIGQAEVVGDALHDLVAAAGAVRPSTGPAGDREDVGAE